MNRYSTVICLGIIFTFLASKSAIAKSENMNYIHACDRISQQVDSSIGNIEKTAKIKQDINQIEQPKTASDKTQTSFWWAIEQFDPFGGKLVQNWLAYPKKQQINLIVNWQLWTMLDYLGRYRFVNQFGTVARKYGYSLNIFNQKEQCLATYKYSHVSNPPKWELHLERLGEDSLQVKPLESFKGINNKGV